MQTQSISKVLSTMQSNASGGAKKTGSADFSSYMSKNASYASAGDRFTQNNSAVKKVESNARELGSSSKDSFNQNRISVTNSSDSSANVESVEVGQVETKVVQLLQDVTGLSEEDIVNILGQLGLVPFDFVLAFVQDSLNMGMGSLNVENIRAFIMEVHGIEDGNLFLMSDQMSGEFTDIVNGIRELLSQEEIQQLQSFAETYGQKTDEVNETVNLGLQAGNEAQQDDQTILPEIENSVKQIAVPEEAKQNAVNSDDAADMPVADMKHEIPVVAEVSEESGASNQTFGRNTSSLPEHVAETSESESPISAFVDRLSESFDAVRQEESIVSRQVTMDRIVEQVVNHVKIRVLPQTTSMELQLNPESLGRVNLNVTSQNGMATATLTVQNQVAKEALESQLTVLRENLESQGLKVEAVEVNVSEFGFKHPEDSNNSQYEQHKKSQKNRRFRFDSVEEVEDSAEAAVMTSEDRRDENSVVDYTA